ncbi:hypothetical protein I3842_15G150300 [Carya illinoinensis]|uniref:Uncharacterized protein n=1 Tax=Carya illinoinensis TaxID=32201 RepID=A0A922A7P1_CARIL|nr:hypothetical protein I3842_15G150300 [Carya illinoinensis]
MSDSISPFFTPTWSHSTLKLENSMSLPLCVVLHYIVLTAGSKVPYLCSTASFQAVFWLALFQFFYVLFSLFSTLFFYNCTHVTKFLRGGDSKEFIETFI